MERTPILTGDLPEGGAIELLRELELQRITGTLSFESPGGDRGEIALYGGEIAVDQPPREDGRDPVDLFLSTEEARYEVHQRLPPLPVAKGDDYVKTGSLAVHVPADLMNYCEHAGLTGVLELQHEGRRAKATYQAGELLAIELDGHDTDDLHEVFAWQQGSFRIAFDTSAPARMAEAPAPEHQPAAESPTRRRKGEDTRQFLNVVQMALADVMRESERARNPSRASPPLPPAPKARPRPKTLPPPPPRRREEQTVRLIYLSGEPPPLPADRSTRHVRADVTGEIALPDATPERRATAVEESDTMNEKDESERSEPSKVGPGAPPERGDDEARFENSSKHAAPEDAAMGGRVARPAAQSDPSEALHDGIEASSGEEPSPPEFDAPAPTPAASAGRRPEPSENGARQSHPLAAFGWTLGVLVVALAALELLAFLPPVSCPPSQESCGWGTGCVDTSSDPAHCGGCNQPCPSNTCVFGECSD